MSLSACCGDGFPVLLEIFWDADKVSRTRRVIDGEVNFETRDNEIQRAVP